METVTTQMAKTRWTKKSAVTIYWLYIAAMASTLFGHTSYFSRQEAGLTITLFSPLLNLLGIVAIIWAYTTRNDAKSTYLESHFRAHIATFWAALLVSLLSFAVFTYFPTLGIVINLVLFIWLIGRFCTGLKALKTEQPIKN